MSEKTRIIDALGERALLLPALVNAALSANDRVKYRLTLLQTARQAADHPGIAPSRLKNERVAAGLRDAEYDDVVAGAAQLAPGRYQIPLADRIVADAWHDVRRNAGAVDRRRGGGGGRFRTPPRGTGAAGRRVRAERGGPAPAHLRRTRGGGQPASAGDGHAQGAQPAAGGTGQRIHRRLPGVWHRRRRSRPGGGVHGRR